MKTTLLRVFLLIAIAGGGTACQTTDTSRSTARHSHSHSSDNRPYNLQQRQFEDPTTPGHRTSPGDTRDIR